MTIPHTVLRWREPSPSRGGPAPASDRTTFFVAGLVAARDGQVEDAVLADVATVDGLAPDADPVAALREAAADRR